MSPTKTIMLVPFILVSFGMYGQFCSGNFGDPSFIIDFGTGLGAAPPISNVPATYQYTNQGCPVEGFYTISNTSQFCFNNTWHVVPFDHTPGDQNGNFLIINALAGPSVIFLDTISGLCPNILFKTEAWILNILKPSGCGGNGSGINPVLVFTITDMQGNLLQQKATNPISETSVFTWLSENLTFPAPSSGTVILKITSNAAAGCGNEFALDDISFTPCGPTITSTFVNYGLTEETICETSQPDILMSSSANGSYTNPFYQWQVSSNSGNSWTDIVGATNQNYLRTPTSSGDFLYRCMIGDASFAGISSCHFPSNPLTVKVVPTPFAQATNYVYGCYGSTIYLSAAGGSTYEWWGPNGFHANIQGPPIPNVSFSDAGIYIVKATTAVGCFDYDTTSLTVYEAPIATLTPTTVSFCEGDSVQLNAGGSLHYKWSPSTGLSNDTIPNPIAKPQKDITYTVRVYNQYTCFDSKIVSFTVWKKPKAFAGPDQYFRKGKAVQLIGNAMGTNISYSWSPPTYLDDPNFLAPRAKPPGTVTYALTVVSNNGCGTSTDSVKLEAIDKLFIPTGFTPNNDGLNDRWEIITFEDYPNGIADVYNRYGQLVYRGYGNDYKPWDGTFKGKPCLPGVYVYMLDLHNGKPILKGTLNLIR
jgi:gliding motility-associated-like protein